MISLKITILTVATIASAALLSACETTRAPQVPGGAAAYEAIPAATAAEPAARTLRPGDEISVSVFREPELSVAKLTLDPLGAIQLPLLGEVAAGGSSPAALARAIEARLGARYLRDPRVTVALLGSPPATVAVEGHVTAPGVFPVGGAETLLSTLARAGSPRREAKLDEVVVFRTVNGQRLGGVFDIASIRAGAAPDPQILDGDVVVVGFSQVKGAYRDFLMAAPLLNLFTVF